MTIYYTHKYTGDKGESHMLLELAMGDYLEDEDKAHELASEIKKRESEFAGGGKPYIKGFDKFSISHSGTSWAVLIATQECGLDIQYERSCDWSNISERFFTDEDAIIIEHAYLEGNGSELQARSEFFRIWTRREALVKAVGSSVVYDGFPPVGVRDSAEHEGKTYFIKNVRMPDADSLHAAICLDASENIDEDLYFKEIHVREE